MAPEICVQTAAGYSGKVAEEIEKLKRMAQRGDRKRLGTLMKDISQIVAEEVVEEQPGLKPKVHGHMISCASALPRSQCGESAQAFKLYVCLSARTRSPSMLALL